MSDIHILVIDDDPAMRGNLRRIYEEAGFVVAEAGTSAEARRALSQTPFDLVTVDVNIDLDNGLRREDGAALAREIHATYDCAIIMISVIIDQEERTSWLESWADDTIMKPFNPKELVARTRAVLRRHGHIAGQGQRQPDIATFGGFVLDFKKLELRAPSGNPISITAGELNLLRNLIKHPHEVLSRDQIIEMDSSIQSMSSADSFRAVDMRVSRLRAKLSDDSGEEHNERNWLIRTVRSAGYLFVADVAWSYSSAPAGQDPLSQGAGSQGHGPTGDGSSGAGSGGQLAVAH
jgi:two-component system, OmpR family, response regulator